MHAIVIIPNALAQLVINRQSLVKNIYMCIHTIYIMHASTWGLIFSNRGMLNCHANISIFRIENKYNIVIVHKVYIWSALIHAHELLKKTLANINSAHRHSTSIIVILECIN